jgi:hypothetical protein
VAALLLSSNATNATEVSTPASANKVLIHRPKVDAPTDLKMDLVAGNKRLWSLFLNKSDALT